MPAKPSGVAAPSIGPYRLLVKADRSGSMGFIWQILAIDGDRLSQRSARSYKSMEEAYEHGAVALKILNRSR
jgi:hypothetical protein